MEVSNATKLICLKCLKAFLGKCFDNGWLPMKFWLSINIKVDKNIKKGVTKNEIEVFLSLLDTTTFHPNHLPIHPIFDKRERMGITLNVNDQIITGNLISYKKYLKETGSSFGLINDEHGLDTRSRKYLINLM
jgi:hypothetical protein